MNTCDVFFPEVPGAECKLCGMPTLVNGGPQHTGLCALVTELQKRVAWLEALAIPGSHPELYVESEPKPSAVNLPPVKIVLLSTGGEESESGGSHVEGTENFAIGNGSHAGPDDRAIPTPLSAESEAFMQGLIDGKRHKT